MFHNHVPIWEAIILKIVLNRCQRIGILESCSSSVGISMHHLLHYSFIYFLVFSILDHKTWSQNSSSQSPMYSWLNKHNSRIPNGKSFSNDFFMNESKCADEKRCSLAGMPDGNWSVHWSIRSYQRSYQLIHLALFWESHGISMFDYLGEGNYYTNMLQELSDKLKEKQPHLPKQKNLFHQDSTSAQKSAVAMVKNHKLRYELMLHSRYFFLALVVI